MTPLRLPAVAARILVGLFVLAVAVPLAGTVMGLDPDGLAEENRTPAPPPVLALDRASLAAWPEAFTRYFADHFAFRSALVRWQATVRVKALRSSTSPEVILGRDGWLFYGHRVATDDFAGAQVLTPSELEAWRLALQHTHDWLASRGVAFVFVIGPDKHVIYPEFMPEGIRRLGTSYRADQLVAYLRARSTVRVVDPRLPLAAGKAFDRLYHRTDTHWNELGALIAYQQVLAGLGRAGDLLPKSRLDFELHRAMVPGKDLARMLGLRSRLPEEELTLMPREPRLARVVEPVDGRTGSEVARVVTERAGALPRAVVFRDSFMTAMMPFLSEHFSRAVYLWQPNFDPAVIEAEHPDIVIQEWVGRNIGQDLPYDAVAALGTPQQ